VRKWVWLGEDAILAIHDEQIAEHGGAAALRDEGLLRSALARPLNLVAYGKPDVAALAAAYGYGIALNHPFVDGNKRVALVAMETFLSLNGWQLSASDEDCVLMILRLADGALAEEALAEWLRNHLERAR
jgi:death-on-curing protein